MTAPASPAAGRALSAALVSAWQAALGAEQRAAFGYGVLGPQLRGPDLTLAVACSGAHEQLRDRTAAALVAAHLTPQQPAADYPDVYLPAGRSAAAAAGTARALALRLEEDCASAWRYLYLVAASATPAGATALRSDAQSALSASAVRATKWRVADAASSLTTPFPGI